MGMLLSFYFQETVSIFCWLIREILSRAYAVLKALKSLYRFVRIPMSRMVLLVENSAYPWFFLFSVFLSRMTSALSSMTSFFEFSRSPRIEPPLRVYTRRLAMVSLPFLLQAMGLELSLWESTWLTWPSALHST